MSRSREAGKDSGDKAEPQPQARRAVERGAQDRKGPTVEERGGVGGEAERRPGDSATITVTVRICRADTDTGGEQGAKGNPDCVSATLPQVYDWVRIHFLFKDRENIFFLT